MMNQLIRDNVGLNPADINPNLGRFVIYEVWKQVIKEVEDITGFKFKITSFIRDIKNDKTGQHEKGASVDVSLRDDFRTKDFKAKIVDSAVYFLQPFILYNLLRLLNYSINLQQDIFVKDEVNKYICLVIGIECDHLHFMFLKTSEPALHNRITIQPWSVNDKYSDTTALVTSTLNSLGLVKTCLLAQRNNFQQLI